MVFPPCFVQIEAADSICRALPENLKAVLGMIQLSQRLPRRLAVWVKTQDTSGQPRSPTQQIFAPRQFRRLLTEPFTKSTFWSVGLTLPRRWKVQSLLVAKGADRPATVAPVTKPEAISQSDRQPRLVMPFAAVGTSRAISANLKSGALQDGVRVSLTVVIRCRPQDRIRPFRTASLALKVMGGRLCFCFQCSTIVARRCVVFAGTKPPSRILSTSDRGMRTALPPIRTKPIFRLRIQFRTVEGCMPSRSAASGIRSINWNIAVLIACSPAYRKARW